MALLPLPLPRPSSLSLSLCPDATSLLWRIKKERKGDQPEERSTGWTRRKELERKKKERKRNSE
jgi:hypothetical protein